MPGRDGTGPNGQGPMTGYAMGACAGDNAQEPSAVAAGTNAGLSADDRTDRPALADGGGGRRRWGFGRRFGRGGGMGGRGRGGRGRGRGWRGPRRDQGGEQSP